MKILFFFVHPANYHLFKHTINRLKTKGYHVDIAIVTKDILEDLVIDAGWKYTNIFPEGRRSKKLPIIFASLINALKTVFRLLKYTAGKNYDLFITDDLLSIVGKIKGVPTLHFQDDDINAVPESAILLKCATKIVGPYCTKFGRYQKKVIAYNGNQELAYLHPNYFIPDYRIVESFNSDKMKYVILRLVSLTASHDRGKRGLSNKNCRKLIELLSQNAKIFITSERKLTSEFEKYRISIKPNDIAHALYFAEMFIGDSQTMTSEAAVLGTPALRLNDFVGKISYIEEEERYGLAFGFKTDDFDKLYEKVEELLQIENLKTEWQKLRQKMLSEKIDVTEFIIKLIACYPDRLKQLQSKH